MARPQRSARGEATDVVSIKVAAEILCVSEMTLRRWDTSGKFKAGRHPMNNYRVYSRSEVLKVRDQIQRAARR